jgi:hypothetical protein
MINKSVFLLVPAFLAFVSARAQTPTDEIMMHPGQICVAGIYEHSWFDEYWEGEKLRTNGTIATVNRNTLTAGLAVGIVKRLNLLASVPYVSTNSTDPNGGYFNGANGVSDLSLALKGEIFKTPMGKGKLALLAVAGFSTPISNYLSDYRPYSIGNGTSEMSFRGILQYRLQSGFFARGAFAYLWRGQTEVERDYYYNNGSFYSNRMDVPSAVNYNAVLGYWTRNNALRIEGQYMGIACLTGDDIRAYNAPQPTNKASFSQAGLMAQYYFPQLPGLSIIGYYSSTLTGRNTGKSSQYGGGIAYVFSFASPDMEHSEIKE